MLLLSLKLSYKAPFGHFTHWSLCSFSTGVPYLNCGSQSIISDHFSCLQRHIINIIWGTWREVSLLHTMDAVGIRTCFSRKTQGQILEIQCCLGLGGATDIWGVSFWERCHPDTTRISYWQKYSMTLLHHVKMSVFHKNVL